jgi:hypothetical protein
VIRLAEARRHRASGRVAALAAFAVAWNTRGSSMQRIAGAIADFDANQSLGAISGFIAHP